VKRNLLCLQTEKWIGIWNLHWFRNQEFLQRKYNCTFFPDPQQNPKNQRSISTDIQAEAGNTKKIVCHVNSNSW